MENYLIQIKDIFLESRKNKLAIIGKGKSALAINLEALKEDFFIINLNDSEEYVKGNFTLFYRTDLFDTIKNLGFRSDFYLSPEYMKIPDDKHIEIAYRPFKQDSFEHIYSYFHENDFYLLDFILLSAIKLAILFQETLVKKLDVYFVGFDFHRETVDEGDIYGLDYRNANLKTQESFFISILKQFSSQYPLIQLHHVGQKTYSSISTHDFNESIFTKRILGSSTKSNSALYHEVLANALNNNRTLIVAEFTNNHIGDKNRLLKMIDLAAESGADLIKVQKRDIDTFYTEEELNFPYHSPFGNTLRDYRKGVELTSESFEVLDSACRDRGIPWFASVLDWNSYLFLQAFDCPLVKLPSTISNHKNYLAKVAQSYSGDIVISTGFTDQSYEDFVLQHFVQNRNLFLLQCTSSYPTPPEGCQVSVVRHYDQIRFKYPSILPGYSSHDIGSLGCMLAVAAGAVMIEKHVKLGDLDWIHFDGVAVDLYNNKFRNFVSDVRKAELMCGGTKKLIHNFEHHKYNTNEKAN